MGLLVVLFHTDVAVLQIFPSFLQQFHEDEVEAISSDRLNDDETTLLERLLCPHVPRQGMEVNPTKGGGVEEVAGQGGDDICAVAVVPVVSVTYQDAELCLPIDGIDVIVHAVAY